MEWLQNLLNRSSFVNFCSNSPSCDFAVLYQKTLHFLQKFSRSSFPLVRHSFVLRRNLGEGGSDGGSFSSVKIFYGTSKNTVATLADFYSLAPRQRGEG
jgi:hypothetical protein